MTPTAALLTCAALGIASALLAAAAVRAIAAYWPASKGGA